MEKFLMQKPGNEITIRPLQPDDVRAIYDLLKPSFVIGDIPYDPGIELSMFSDWLARRNPEIHRFVAVADEEITGLPRLTHKSSPRLNHSGSIVIAARARSHYEETRQALLAAALDLADNWLNLYRLEVEVLNDSKIDIDYFQSIGFEVEGTRLIGAFRQGKWLDHICMARLRFNPQWSDSSQMTASVEADVKPVNPRRQIEDIEIRPARIGDAIAFYDMLCDPAICRTTLQLPSQEIRQTEERLMESHSWLHRFTAVADGEIVGSIILAEVQSRGHQHIARIGMKVHSAYWRLGIGSLLMISVTDLADNWLNTTRIELDVNTDNPAGIHLYQKFGSVIEGTKRLHGYGDGRWADSHFMDRIQKE
jgi:putative acetyltransferase